MSDRAHIVSLVLVALLLVGCWAAWYARKSYEHDACAESGGTWHEGMIAGSWSYWCDGGNR